MSQEGGTEEVGKRGPTGSSVSRKRGRGGAKRSGGRKGGDILANHPFFSVELYVVVSASGRREVTSEFLDSGRGAIGGVGVSTVVSWKVLAGMRVQLRVGTGTAQGLGCLV